MTFPARRVRDVAVALFVALALMPGAAQEPPAGDPPGQVFRSAVDFVRVDAYPRRHGRIVEGLSAADFTIFEDGQPQAVDSFEFVRHAADPGYKRLDPRNREEAERWVADPRRRLFIIYLDLYHITRASSHQIRGPLMQVLAEAIGPSDIVAVMTPETLTGDLAFAQTLNTLSAEIERYWEFGLLDAPMGPRNPAEARLAECGNSVDGFDRLIERFREDVLFTSLEALIAYTGALRADRTNVILLSEGWRNVRGGVDIRNLNDLPGRSQIQIRQQAGRPPGSGGPRVDPFGRPTGDIAVARPSSCTEQLLRLEVDHEDRFRRLFQVANANNVSFHPIDVGGLRTSVAAAASRSPGPVRSPGNQQMLQELAENTDGVATVNVNDVGLGLRRVIDHTSAYYLLGYSSTNTATDGRYRRIEVRVSQRGVGVTARRGYTAVSGKMQALADARSVRERVPSPVAAALGRLSRWDEDARLRGAMGIDDGATTAVTAPMLVWGQARLWRVPAIGRAVAEPAGAPIFRRGERLRLEWQPTTTPVAPDVRLLDRRGGTLNPGASMAVTFDATQRILRVELYIAALAEGDYVIEARLGVDDNDERQWIAFRVTR